MSEQTKILRRYPGVQPFKREQSALFFGRDDDREQLLDLILLEKLIVLFGRSGFGKSSLLNAGIIPELQKENARRKVNFVPLQIRFTAWTGNADEDLIQKFLSVLEKEMPNIAQEAQFLQNTVEERHPETVGKGKGVRPTLWVACKLRQSKPLPRFVLMFDQFEEFFTYPLEQQIEFKKQLAELLYADLPASIWQVKADWTAEQEAFLSQPMDVRTILSIRADRMSLLDSLKDKLPAILQKRYELKGLGEKQAKDAIVKPARLDNAQFITPPFEYTDKALEKILNELSDHKNKAIEAFQVQIVCEEIEKEVEKGSIPDRDGNGLPDVDIENLPDFDNLYENYYRRKVAELPPFLQTAARLLIEEKLIFEDDKTGESRRLSVDAGVLRHDTGIKQSLLDQLESTFLLRREANSMGGFNYEVSHDTMIAPILKSKSERKALERAEAEKIESKKRLRKIISATIILLLVGFLLIAGIRYFINVKKEAEQAKLEADIAKREAQKALKDLKIANFENDLRKAKLQLGAGCLAELTLANLEMTVNELFDSVLIAKIEELNQEIKQNRPDCPAIKIQKK